MTDTVHFSTLMKRGLCGKQGKYTGTPDKVTCERCKAIVAKASATEVDLWALEAAENERFGKPKPSVTCDHVRELFALSVVCREREVQKALDRVEHEKEELERMKRYARDFDLDVAMAMDGM